METAELQLEINQGNIKGLKKIYKKLIDFKSYFGYFIHLFRGGQIHSVYVRAIYERIAQLVVFIIIFQNSFGHFGAFGQAETL